MNFIVYSTNGSHTCHTMPCIAVVIVESIHGNERNKSKMHEPNENRKYVEMNRIGVSISISKQNKLFILSAVLPRSQFVVGVDSV